MHKPVSYTHLDVYKRQALIVTEIVVVEDSASLVDVSEFFIVIVARS